MHRLSVIVVLGVLISAGSAQASIGRTQSFGIGALNEVVWSGCVGSAWSQNQASFVQRQEFTDRHTGTSGVQVGAGSLVQTAAAGGGGSATARQTAGINGWQSLPTGSSHSFPGRMQQELGAKLGTDLSKPNGVGSVAGTQTFTGAQAQAVTTPSTTGSQSQFVDIKQSGAITTGTNTDPTVRNRISVDLQQSQIAGGH